MQTKYLCVLIHIWIKDEVGAPLNRFKPSSKIFYWPFQGSASFVDLLCFCSVLCLQCLCARLFICALWSPAGKGLTSWLSFVVSNCECITFPLVSWVGCGTWLYWLLIFAPLLTLLFIVTPIVGFCNCSMFCCRLLYVPSSFASILMGKRELSALLSLSSWCLMIVVWLFLAVP